jgi:hypothetical protein
MMRVPTAAVLVFTLCASSCYRTIYHAVQVPEPAQSCTQECERARDTPFAPSAELDARDSAGADKLGLSLVDMRYMRCVSECDGVVVKHESRCEPVAAAPGPTCAEVEARQLTPLGSTVRIVVLVITGVVVLVAVSAGYAALCSVNTGGCHL